MSETKMDHHRQLMELERKESEAKEALADALRDARDNGLHNAIGLHESIAIRHVIDVANHRRAVKGLLQGLIKPQDQTSVSEDVKKLAGKVYEAIEAFESASQRLRDFKHGSAA